MAKITVNIPQGTRDFDAITIRKRNFIFDTIRSVFELYGFEPLETPAMENLDTLMGKYGDEGDKLIFRILDSGNPFSVDFFKIFINFFEKNKQEFEIFKAAVNRSDAQNIFTNPLELTPEYLSRISTILFKSEYLPNFKNEISEKALRYDLTIPFARYVAMNHGQLTFPFKRYQMQPVWRADRPQKGRYREFYQCDADVVGSYSLLNEVELANIYATVFKKLGVDVEIKINNRKILSALAELCGGADKMIDITIAIDKLDKIGLEKVKEELIQRGLNEEQIKVVENYISILNYSAKNVDDAIDNIVLEKLKEFFAHNETGKQGIKELEFILGYGTNKWPNNIIIDPTLARGLNYYTGTIFEVKANNVQMGSIGGGGRYDDLTGLFGLPGIPGVGISFGVDRIYDVMEELKLFPGEVHAGTQVLFFNLGEAECKTAFALMQQLRGRNIRCEIFHERAKFDKQFKYAVKKGIHFAVIIGSKELEEGTCVIKDLRTSEQKSILQHDLPSFLF